MNHECPKCENYGLKYNRKYRPSDFLEGKRSSLIWIMGLNPKGNLGQNDERDPSHQMPTDESRTAAAEITATSITYSAAGVQPTSQTRPARRPPAGSGEPRMPPPAGSEDPLNRSSGSSIRATRTGRAWLPRPTPPSTERA